MSKAYESTTCNDYALDYDHQVLVYNSIWGLYQTIAGCKTSISSYPVTLPLTNCPEKSQSNFKMMVGKSMTT